MEKINFGGIMMIYTNKKIYMDPFLDYLKDNYESCPCPLPNFPSIIEEYRSLIYKDCKHAKDEVIELIRHINPKDEIYNHTFTLPGKAKYFITWSVSELRKSVSKYNLQRTTLPLDKLVPVAHNSFITLSYLDKAVEDEEPILIVKYPMCSPCFCIADGNHRVMAKYVAGESTIQGYILEPEHHIDAMLFNVHRTLFKVHYNLNEIGKCMNLEKPINKVKLLPLKYK